MRALLVDDAGKAQSFLADDSYATTETTFEASVLRCLALYFRSHIGIVFGGSFRLDADVRRADLALVARDLSHWFVIEVELLSHSLEGHVLPQVRTLSFGDPEPDCQSVLSKALGIDLERAKTLVTMVPRATVVITNGHNQHWAIALAAIRAQYLSISRFRADGEKFAFGIEGDLEIVERSIGFGIYDAVDNTIRMKRNYVLPGGAITIEGSDGVLSSWQVIHEDDASWLVKNGSRLGIGHQLYVQLLLTISGRYLMRYK